MGLSFFRKLQKRNRDRVIQIDGAPLPVRVVENDRAKRLTLRIVPGGEALKVTAPGHVDDWEIDAFLERNKNWAAARLARLPQRTSLVENALIPFRGVDHRITSTGKLRGIVEAMEIEGEPIIRVPGEEVAIGRKCLAYLKRQARADLDFVVARHARQNRCSSKILEDYRFNQPMGFLFFNQNTFLFLADCHGATTGAQLSGGP